MSRISIIEQLYADRQKSALEFNWDGLWAPPIYSILSQYDIARLIKIATSVKFNGNISKKYKLIDNIMTSRGFKRAHCGTNRIVYNYLEDTRFVAKVAIDKVGMRDSPGEFINQRYFKPFCTKIFEVDPSGVIAFVERVHPITTIEEFVSVADDIFTMMITKVIGKYVVDDLGATKFMNYGLRLNSNGCNFGPVILDFPYVYELDGNKLICNQKDKNTGSICGGDIDYTGTLDRLYCTKCNKTYTAQELSKDSSGVIVLPKDDSVFFKVRIKDLATGKVVKVLGDNRSSTYLSKEEIKERNNIVFMSDFLDSKTIKGKIVTDKRKKRKSKNSMNNLLTDLQKKMIDEFNEKEKIKNNIVNNTVSELKKAINSNENYIKERKTNMTIKGRIVDSISTTEEVTYLSNSNVSEDDIFSNSNFIIKGRIVNSTYETEPINNTTSSEEDDKVIIKGKFINGEVTNTTVETVEDNNAAKEESKPAKTTKKKTTSKKNIVKGSLINDKKTIKNKKSSPSTSNVKVEEDDKSKIKYFEEIIAPDAKNEIKDAEDIITESSEEKVEEPIIEEVVPVEENTTEIVEDAKTSSEEQPITVVEDDDDQYLTEDDFEEYDDDYDIEIESEAESSLDNVSNPMDVQK